MCNNCELKKCKKKCNSKEPNFLKGYIKTQVIPTGTQGIVEFIDFKENDNWESSSEYSIFYPRHDGDYLVSIRLAVKNYIIGTTQASPKTEEFGIQMYQGTKYIDSSISKIPCPPSDIDEYNFIKNSVLVTNTFIAKDLKANIPITLKIEDFGSVGDLKYLEIQGSTDINNTDRCESIISITKI